MSRRTGRKGAMFIPVGVGNLRTNIELSPAASKTLGGVTYTDRFVGTATRSAWNKGLPHTFRAQGINGEVTIKPGTANDTVDVSIFQYFKDNTTVQTSAAIVTLTLTRDAAKAQWHCIHAPVATGVADKTAGVLSANTAFVDTFGAAGGPALIPVADIMLGAVKLTPGAAGPVLASDIVVALSTGALLQERADMPHGTKCSLAGGVLFKSALLKCHAGDLARKVFATFYDQYPYLTQIGDIDGWTLNGTRDTTKLEACEDIAPELDFASAAAFNGTLARFYMGDATMFKMAMQRGSAILKLFPDYDEPANYFEASAMFKSWSIGVAMGSGIKENESFECDGPVEAVGIV